MADVEQALDRDLGAGLAVEGAIDGTHRPTGNGCQNFIAPVERFSPDGCRLLIRSRQVSGSSP
jgi:hypothetical protein